MAQNVYSQSEVDSYLSCEMKHYYAFGEPCPDGSHGIAPKTHGEGLTRGNIGHELFANYYSAIRDGISVDQAREGALVEHYSMMLQNTHLMPIYNQIGDIFTKYVTHYADEFDEWQPVAIEHEFRVKIPGPEGMEFAFKPDAVMKNKHTGKVYIWDHKFLYNFYKDRVLGIMPQMAKYKRALELLGYAVEDGIYNQISTRPNSKDPFRRIPTGITKAKADQFWHEQVTAQRRIHRLKTQLTNEEWREQSLRTASSFNCDHCPFLELCTFDISKANGRKLLLNQSFEPNKYGYGKEDSNGAVA